MKQIKILQGHRWFIWAVIFIVASLGGLAVYIYNSYQSDSAEVNTTLVKSNHTTRLTPIKESRFIGTTWVPEIHTSKKAVDMGY